MKARNKKLARIIGVALSLGVVMGMNPMEADAAILLIYAKSENASSYGICCAQSGVWEVKSEASDAASSLQGALQRNVADGTVLDFANLGDNGALLNALTGKKIKLCQNCTVTITDGSGTYSITTGSGNAVTVTRVSDGAYALGGGSVANITLNGQVAHDYTTDGSTVYLNTITADTVTIGSGAKFDTAGYIYTNSLTIDGAVSAEELAKLNLSAPTGTEKVSITIKNVDKQTYNNIVSALKNNENVVSAEIAAYTPSGSESGGNEGDSGSGTGSDSGDSGTGGDASVDTETPETMIEKANKQLESAEAKLAQVNQFAIQEENAIAQANPFTTALPSATDLAEIANPSAEKLSALDEARENLTQASKDIDAKIKELDEEQDASTIKELTAKKAQLDAKAQAMSPEALQARAESLQAAVQEAGKPVVSLGVSSARTAGVVTEIMTGNVVARTAELRGAAGAVDDGRPAPDNVWFQYKHTNMDVDGGGVYSKSTIKTNNYQLGYDTKIGDNDYLGAYIGTSDGSVESNIAFQSGNADIDNAFEFGIYGTHMLPKDQYIDYMIHTGKFDQKYSGTSWGTRDTGAMVGYGAKIAANDRLTWNPYVQLSYDKVSVDSFKIGPNSVSSDSSNNWNAKVGINLIDSSGFYGGVAYSRGLSGSYNAYVNGVPMPTQDYNANIMYLSLGYRAGLSQKVFLDISAEKTFGDYKGWTATGKVNFYF